MFMHPFSVALALAFGYLCGSIPFGLLLTRFAGAPVATDDLFESSRRTTWPFHIHNPERIITGTKT